MKAEMAIGDNRMKENTEAQETKSGFFKGVGMLIAQIITCIICIVIGWVIKDNMPEETKEAENPMAAMMNTPQTVAVAAAELRPYNLPREFIAHAEPIKEVEIIPQVEGFIKSINFKEGDVVQKGAVLYRLDDARYRAVVNQRIADLEAARAEEKRAESYNNRMMKVFQTNSAAVPESERDNALAAYEKARSSVKQAEANLAEAKYYLDHTEILAPISGQIGKNSAHDGAFVAPSKGALAKIVQIDPIRVSFPLTDRDYLDWRKAQKKGEEENIENIRIRLRLADKSMYDQEGDFDFDDNAMNPSTATVQMRLSFANPDRMLLSDSYVTVLFDKKNPPQYPSVPQSAIFDVAGGGVAVWVVGADGRVAVRPVQMLSPYLGWVPVTDGLKVGEQVVTSGVGKLAPGMKVRDIEPTPNEDIDPNFKPSSEE